MPTEVCEGREPHAPHTLICACCGVEYTTGNHDWTLCSWQREQRRLYEGDSLELRDHPGGAPGAPGAL